MQNDTIIKIEKLKFFWPEQETAFLQIPYFELGKKQKLFVRGPSGSGKSSFLNLIAGLLLPKEGSIELCGKNILSLSSSERDQWRAQKCGFIFQQFNLIPYLSVIENLRLPSYFLSNLPVDQSLQERIEHLLSSIQLDPKQILNKKAYELSVGQQQRLAVVRALLHKPDLIIADEPSSALDSDARDAFMNILTKESAESCCSLLFVSHDQDLAKYFDTKIDIRDWRT